MLDLIYQVNPFSIHSQYEKSKQPEIIHIEENNFGSHASIGTY
jgi:hypothetical protein